MRRGPSAETFAGLNGGWSYILLSGVAWGCVVTTFESLSQPPLDLTLAEYGAFYSRIFAHYSAGGVLLAFCTAYAAYASRGVGLCLMIMLSLASAMTLALSIDWLSVHFVPYWTGGPMADMWQPFDISVHMAWIFGMYGGLYAVTFLLLRREAVTRERLRTSDLARARAEAEIERAISERTAENIAPGLLLGALDELARRYNDHEATAERLLDRLVQMLRLASSPTARHGAGKDRRAAKDELTTSIDRLKAELMNGDPRPLNEDTRREAKT